ncbi:Multicopper oxidase type 2 [Penicillium vulpinum]|uniref:Multicopper oxidase type 2 n=1 Tax=Penicillium vulpinum TaxID=29845 RepID=UPI002546E947|nr:Multicopper oxidase type 2 [Penicillium vulpinum]KAJ5958183.1 Multicopper oxidase type 2 [Penicillium vulpinum]
MAKFSFFALATWVGLAAAKDVYLNWNVTWVNASPDGFARPVIGINGQWPCPQIDVNVGDQLIVDVYNGLGNESTGIHWHGMRQFGSAVMDGAVGVTQCPIAPGSHMQYHFDVNQTGTYWYHSHDMGQYPDGFRGALIVHDPNPPFHYDDEFTITLSDWYHKQMPELLNTYLSEAGLAAHGAEPLPDSALINDSTNTKIKVLPNKTYLVHIICVGNWPGHFWVFDGHEMTVVEVDGVYTEPYPAGDKFLRVATGQRMSVLIKTKSDTSRNFAIWDTMDINMMFIFENRTIPENFNPNATAWLVYDEDKPLPEPPVFHHIDFNTDFVDDVNLVPADHEPLLQPVNHQIILDTNTALVDGLPRFTVNGKTYIAPEVPSLYTANTVGPEFSSDPAVYGQVNPFVVKYGEVVEIVINNHHNNLHPWHLHGHQFQVLQRTPVDGGYYTGLSANVSTTPIRRDTIMVQNHGHVVIRFRADNPGVWMFHCHIEWHVESGLMATIIEAPETFPNTLHAPPQSHYDTCNAYPKRTSGNAAGNSGLDMTGANTKVSGDNHGALYIKKGANIHAGAPPAHTSAQAPTYDQAPQASQPSYSPSHHPHGTAVPSPNYSPLKAAIEKIKDNLPVPLTDKTHFRADSPNQPQDNYVPVHQESTKAPWQNQNTHSTQNSGCVHSQ